MKVMIATDGTEGALDAARRAMELFPPGATVSLVAVVPSRVDPMEDAGGFEGPVLTDDEADEEWDEGVAAGEAALADTAQALADTARAHADTARTLGPDVETLLVPSDEPPGRALVRLATEHTPDVLIIGSERAGFFERLFGRSVTDEVVHHAPCPVLVVPHRT